MSFKRIRAFPLMAALLLASCAFPPRENPAQESGVPIQTGMASWYGAELQGRRTANGEIFDQNTLSAAHRTWPMPSLVEVTNLENGKHVVVRVNDRGPYAQGRIIDLSRAAARELGFEQAGEARVSLRYEGPAPPRP